MTVDIQKLKVLAETAADDQKHYLARAQAEADLAKLLSPAAVLELIAEIERLKAQVRLAGVSAEMTVHQAVGRAATDSLLVMHERDQLKAENAFLRKALTTIREESSDLTSCECAADALVDSRKEPRP